MHLSKTDFLYFQLRRTLYRKTFLGIHKVVQVLSDTFTTFTFAIRYYQLY